MGVTRQETPLCTASPRLSSGVCGRTIYVLHTLVSTNPSAAALIFWEA